MAQPGPLSIEPPPDFEPRQGERFAVVDVGSNSIRLVVFERLCRAPTPLINEKATCSLGRGLKETGQLWGPGVARALPSLERFSTLARTLGIERPSLIATAAVREAENGPSFAREVEARCGVPLKVISGEEEARLSAAGVLAGIPDASGLVGDLGGGSLELVELRDGVIGRTTTLPLGPLRLGDIFQRGRQAAAREIDRQLSRVPWLAEAAAGSRIFPVGGAWRSVARGHMLKRRYPLSVIHTYAIGTPEADGWLDQASRGARKALLDLDSISTRRMETLPYAALLLIRIAKATGAESAVFSAFGLREGLLYESLDEAERGRDPLMVAAQDIARRESRFGDIARELEAWIAPALPDGEAGDARLRRAICHLSDFAWREHPDYRAEQALRRLLYYPFVGLDHPGRAYLAAAVHARYGGGDTAAFPELSLLEPSRLVEARRLGLALRLAYSLSGGSLEVLGRSKLSIEHGLLFLTVPSAAALAMGETIEKRLGVLAGALGLDGWHIRS